MEIGKLKVYVCWKYFIAIINIRGTLFKISPADILHIWGQKIVWYYIKNKSFCRNLQRRRIKFGCFNSYSRRNTTMSAKWILRMIPTSEIYEIQRRLLYRNRVNSKWLYNLLKTKVKHLTYKNDLFLVSCIVFEETIVLTFWNRSKCNYSL